LEKEITFINLYLFWMMLSKWYWMNGKCAELLNKPLHEKGLALTQFMAFLCEQTTVNLGKNLDVLFIFVV